jgi:hypothetical protein
MGALLAVFGLTFLGLVPPDALAAGGGLLDVFMRLLPSLFVVGANVSKFFCADTMPTPGREAQAE